MAKIGKYRGAMGGWHNYPFFAIPTTLHTISPYTPRYHYIYYLLNTASPISTLTLEAFNCLNAGNDQAALSSRYGDGMLGKTAGIVIAFYASDRVMPGVNVLALDFLS